MSDTTSTPPSLEAAARAVLARWDSPSWSWDPSSHTADLMHALRAALGGPVQSVDAPPGADMSPVAHRKLFDLIAEGYHPAGYVLKRPDSRHVILWDAAVRWLTDEERHRLMHVEGSLTAPQPAQTLKRLTADQIVEACGWKATRIVRAVEQAIAEANGMKLEDTRMALIALMVAIEADNAERPDLAFPPRATKEGAQG